MKKLNHLRRMNEDVQEEQQHKSNKPDKDYMDAHRAYLDNFPKVSDEMKEIDKVASDRSLSKEEMRAILSHFDQLDLVDYIVWSKMSFRHLGF